MTLYSLKQYERERTVFYSYATPVVKKIFVIHAFEKLRINVSH